MSQKKLSSIFSSFFSKFNFLLIQPFLRRLKLNKQCILKTLTKLAHSYIVKIWNYIFRQTNNVDRKMESIIRLQIRFLGQNLEQHSVLRSFTAFFLTINQQKFLLLRKTYSFYSHPIMLDFICKSIAEIQLRGNVKKKALM